jgi:hypothetical protein
MAVLNKRYYLGQNFKEQSSLQVTPLFNLFNVILGPIAVVARQFIKQNMYQTLMHFLYYKYNNKNEQKLTKKK